MTRAKLKHIIPIREELDKRKGETLVAKDIADVIGISPLRVGKILSNHFQGTYVDHVGYSYSYRNKHGKKVYKVRNNE